MSTEFVLGFSGFSGSGKTTLLEKVVGRFAHKISIGYLKHDVHGFSMDVEGKDTHRLRAAGAVQVAIGSPLEWASLGAQPGGVDLRDLPAGPDWWLVEGYKDASIDRVVFLDAEGRMASKLAEEGLGRTVAFVVADEGGAKAADGLSPHLPVFHRDAVESVADFVESIMKSKAAPLRGLVLAGGKSIRMGEDKALLHYHGMPQYRFAVDCLLPHCVAVSLSLRPGQELGQIDALPARTDILQDRFLEFGPVGGMLSALEADPRSAWLVVACDMPLLDAAAIGELVEGRNPYRVATALRDPAKDFPEPLAAIWEPKARGLLLHNIARNVRCPRKTLLNSPNAEVIPSRIEVLDNANDPIERSRLHEILSASGAVL